MGTDSKFEAYRKRVMAAKPSERAAVEAKELAQVEEEGFRAEKLAERGIGFGRSEGVTKGKSE